MNRRLQIIETNFGRACGWYVEREGQRLAVLTDVEWTDMFWDSYRAEPLTSGAEAMHALFSNDFWADTTQLTFRNRQFDDVAPWAFACGRAGTMLKETGRLLMRGLYLPVRVYPWDRLRLRLARAWK